MRMELGTRLAMVSYKLAVGLLAAMVAAGAVACSTNAALVALPKKPSRSQLATQAAAPLSKRQLVVAAYEGYWQATNQALDTRNKARAEAILAGYVPRTAIPALLKGLGAIWRRGEIGYGSPVFHIISVKLTGNHTAAVHDCLDLSHVGFQNASGGLILGGPGRSHQNLITMLALEHGHWLVTGSLAVVRPCAY